MGKPATETQGTNDPVPEEFTDLVHAAQLYADWCPLEAYEAAAILLKLLGKSPPAM